MQTIIPIQGKVKFPITLDSGVWIFDDRRIDLNTYFSEENEEPEAEEAFTVTSKHWDRVIKEGSVAPPTLKSERQFEKVKVLTGTFGIKFEPFLKNAEPDEDANSLVIKTSSGDITIPLSDAYDLIFQYSQDGKILQNGPIHILFPDGSNRDNPIRNVRAFEVK